MCSCNIITQMNFYLGKMSSVSVWQYYKEKTSEEERINKITEMQRFQPSKIEFISPMQK